MGLQREQGLHTCWRWRRSVIGSDHGWEYGGSRDNIQSGGRSTVQCSDHGVTKRVRTTYFLEVETEQDRVRMWMRLQRVGTTYCLEVEMECDWIRSPMGLQTEREVRTHWRCDWVKSWMWLQREWGQHTAWRWRWSVIVSDHGWGLRRAGTTYFLEVEMG